MILNENDKKDLTFAMRKSIIGEFKKNPTWFGNRLQEAISFILEGATYEQLLNLTFNPERGKKEYTSETLELMAVKTILEQNKDVEREVLFESLSTIKNVLLEKKKANKNWIAGAIKHPGALHKSLHVKKGEKIPAAKLAKAAHSKNPKLKKRAVLAQNLKNMHKKK